MIIVKFHGGLGNQMFQYALYRKMEIIGKQVKADLSWYQSNMAESARDFELFQFPVTIAQCSEAEKKKRNNKFYELLRKYFGVSMKLWREKAGEGYNEKVLKLTDAYIDGYWQTPKYFADIRERLLEDFVFPKEENTALQRLEKEIAESDSVSIHIRRGDYLNNMDKYGDICTEDYYRRAVVYMAEKIVSPRFFVFSDDMKWSREFMRNQPNTVFVEGKQDESPIMDMKRMALCRHNIIANSSFSWWASWLNQNPGKIVVAPAKWKNDFDLQDIRCENWVTVQGS